MGVPRQPRRVRDSRDRQARQRRQQPSPEQLRRHHLQRDRPAQPRPGPSRRRSRGAGRRAHRVLERRARRSLLRQLHEHEKSYPAALDPQFAGTLLDPGYLTPEPGSHRSLFYAPATDVDDRIIERDEATKGTFTLEEIGNIPLILAARLEIDVPVLVVNGTLDGIFCGQSIHDLGTDCSTEERIVEQESPHFPEAPSLSAILVPGVGHDLNAFRQAPAAFQGANQWLARTMPPA